MTNSPLNKKTSFYLPPKDTLETMGSDDPLWYYYHPLVGFLYRARIKQALSLLSPPYGSILEVGYGSGILMPTLMTIGKSVSGIDIDSDPERVKSNLEKIGVYVSLKRGDVCEADYPDESFDLVIAISILEHLNNIERLINKVFCLLRPGGHFLVGMPRIGNLMEFAFCVLGYNAKKHHITNYMQFLKISCRFFNLVSSKRIPPWTPMFAGLYFNTLLSKRANKVPNNK